MLPLLDKRAVVSGARNTVRIRKHAPTDASAGIYINRNGLLLLFLSIQSLERGVQRVFL